MSTRRHHLPPPPGSAARSCRSRACSPRSFPAGPPHVGRRPAPPSAARAACSSTSIRQRSATWSGSSWATRCNGPTRWMPTCRGRSRCRPAHRWLRAISWRCSRPCCAPAVPPWSRAAQVRTVSCRRRGDRAVRGPAARRQAGPGASRLRHHDRAAAQHFLHLRGPVHPAAGRLAEDIRIDPGRNAILFSGTASERQNVVQTLEDLDVDWMAGKSIRLFPRSAPMPRRSCLSCRRSSPRSTRPAPSLR